MVVGEGGNIFIENQQPQLVNCFLENKQLETGADFRHRMF
jgi:hypothetical protein